MAGETDRLLTEILDELREIKQLISEQNVIISEVEAEDEDEDEDREPWR